jgi:hypothetical protein
MPQPFVDALAVGQLALSFVIAALVAAIRALLDHSLLDHRKTWMPATSAGMTEHAGTTERADMAHDA